jgi:hypothetical protein
MGYFRQIHMASASDCRMASPGTCNLQTCYIDPVRHQVRQRTCLKEHQRGQKTRRPLSSDVCIVCWFIKLYKPHEYYIYNNIYTHSFIDRYRIHYSSSGSSWVFVSSHHGHGMPWLPDSQGHVCAVAAIAHLR